MNINWYNSYYRQFYKKKYKYRYSQNLYKNYLFIIIHKIYIYDVTWINIFSDFMINPILKILIIMNIWTYF